MKFYLNGYVEDVLLEEYKIEVQLTLIISIINNSQV